MLFPESLIDFFKTHNLYDENIFNYLESITTKIDYQTEKERVFIGCYYKLNKQNILSNLKIIIPKITNVPIYFTYKTRLLLVNEIS